jgi:hypothetical protein
VIDELQSSLLLWWSEPDKKPISRQALPAFPRTESLPRNPSSLTTTWA